MAADIRLDAALWPEIKRSDHFVGLSLVPYRLANEMPELKLLLQMLGEAHISKQLPLLRASFAIPLALPGGNQNEAAGSGGEREARGQVEI